MAPVHILGKNWPRSDPHITYMGYYLGPREYVLLVLGVSTRKAKFNTITRAGLTQICIMNTQICKEFFCSAIPEKDTKV